MSIMAKPFINFLSVNIFTRNPLVKQSFSTKFCTVVKELGRKSMSTMKAFVWAHYMLINQMHPIIFDIKPIFPFMNGYMSYNIL